MAEINHSERKHALLSASGASRWLNCTPSPRLEEQVEDKDSVFAAEGTLAHEFCDSGLQFESGRISEKEYSEIIKKLEAEELYKPEMHNNSQVFIDYVMQEFEAAKLRTEDAVLMIEERVDYSQYVENGFGTGDAVIIADRLLEVADYKNGMGVRVNAEDNPQLKLYGLGALTNYDMMYDIETVRLTVVQPRLDHIDSWDISVKDLYEWAEKEVKPKAEIAYEGKGEQKSGPWCKFCKVKAQCRTLAEETMATAKHDFTDPMLLTDDEILEIYKESGKYIDWLNSLGTYMLQSALDGKQWDGYKLVAGRSNRVWKDQEKVKEKLQDLAYSDTEIFNTKLKGIGDIEKLLGKKEFGIVMDELVIKPPGKPTLATHSDKRAPLSLNSAKDDFQ